MEQKNNPLLSKSWVFPLRHLIARYGKRPVGISSNCAFVAICAAMQLAVFLFLFTVFADGDIAEAEESAIYFLFFSLAPALSLIGYRLWAGISTAPEIADRYLKFLVVALPLGPVLFGLSHIGNLVYFTYEIPAPAVPFSRARFVLGFLLYALIAFFLFRLFHRREAIADGNTEIVPTIVKIIGMALIVSLFDIYMMIDTLSLSPYAAPAFLVANGHTPLIDAFSQYGLNFLIFSAAFTFLPTSLFTMSAIIGALNILMYMVFIGITVNVSRNKLTVFVIAVCVVFFVHSAHLYNITYTPSVLAMRFLPPLALVFSLTLLQPGRFFSKLSVTLLGLCALWSIEALIFGAMTYAAYVLLCSVGDRKPVTHLVRCFLGIAVIATLPHVVISVVYMATLGMPPDYGTYLQLVFFHFLDGPYWKLLIEPGLWVWSLFGFGYVTALALAAHIALRRTRGNGEFPRSIATIGAVALLGILMFYYYIGRSATPILMFISLPLFLVAIAAVDWSISQIRHWGEATNRSVPVLAPLVLTVSLVCFPLLGGVFADKFFRPFSQHLSNSSILRNWTQAPIGRNVRVSERIKTMKRTTAANDSYPENEAGGSLSYTHAENRAAFELIRTLGTEKQKVLMFVADPVPVLFHTPERRLNVIAYPPHRIGIAYPAVDGLSATLSERALSVLTTLSAGNIVLVGTLQRTPLDETFLSRLRQSWTLCKIEFLAPVSAYRLHAKDGKTCD